MNTLIHLAETWWPLYAVHMVEISFFIVLVWSVDRWLALDSRLRYALYLLALAKVFVPPVLAIPIPAFLVSPAGVAVDATAYFGAVSEAVAVFPEPAATLPPAFYLFCLWILSVLVWTGAALWKNAAFRRALKPASPVDLASEIASLNAPETLKVYSRPTLPSPILVGLRRPRLFLPSKWSSWSSEELRGVLKHELAHYERRDIYVLTLQALATALFGANPLIWLLNRRLAYLRELRCDEAVLRETNLTPADYGRLLLGFVDTRSSPGPLTVFFTERGATLKKRLEHILNYKAGNMNRSKRQTVALILVGLMIVPLSIREAYTQNDVSKSATNVEMAVPRKVQRTAPPVTGNSDTVTVGVPTDDEAEVEEKPVTVSQLKSTVAVQDAFMQFVNSRTAPDTGFVATVTLNVRADVHGSVEDVKLVNVEGPAGFENAVRDAVSRMKFEPAKQDSANAPLWFTQQVSFHWFGTSMRPEPANPPSPADTGPADVLEIDQVETKPYPIRIVAPGYPNPAFRAAEHKGKIVSVSKLARENTPPEQERILEFRSVDVRPVVTHTVQPVFPDSALKAGLPGTVFLKFKVNVDGSVSDVSVLKGDDIFRKPAIDAILQFRYIPAEHEGSPVAVWMTQHFSFQLINPPLDSHSEPSPTGRDTATAHVVLESDVVGKKPYPIRIVAPEIPEAARGEDIVGPVLVLLRFRVDVNGLVSDVSVLKGPEVFHKSAIEAVLQWSFRPAEHNGRAVPVWLNAPIQFAFTPPEPQEDTDHRKGDIGRDKVFEISEVDIAPVPPSLLEVRPNYPEVAQKAGLTGRVVLKFKVDEDGSVSDVHVLKGDEIFREPAIEAVKRLRYQPAELDGKPVPVWMTQRIAFALPKNQDETVSDTSDTGVGD